MYYTQEGFEYHAHKNGHKLTWTNINQAANEAAREGLDFYPTWHGICLPFYYRFVSPPASRRDDPKYIAVVSSPSELAGDVLLRMEVYYVPFQQLTMIINESERGWQVGEEYYHDLLTALFKYTDQPANIFLYVGRAVPSVGMRYWPAPEGFGLENGELVLKW